MNGRYIMQTTADRVKSAFPTKIINATSVLSRARLASFPRRYVSPSPFFRTSLPTSLKMRKDIRGAHQHGQYLSSFVYPDDTSKIYSARARTENATQRGAMRDAMDDTGRGGRGATGHTQEMRRHAQTTWRLLALSPGTVYFPVRAAKRYFIRRGIHFPLFRSSRNLFLERAGSNVAAVMRARARIRFCMQLATAAVVSRSEIFSGISERKRELTP